jgi:hypothetical protein
MTVKLKHFSYSCDGCISFLSKKNLTHDLKQKSVRSSSPFSLQYLHIDIS